MYQDAHDKIKKGAMKTEYNIMYTDFYVTFLFQWRTKEKTNIINRITNKTTETQQHEIN